MSLEKQIHDLAMAVRKGDMSKYPELKALREKRCELAGVAQPKAPEPKKEQAAKPELPVEPEQPAEADPEVAKEQKSKKKR